MLTSRARTTPASSRRSAGASARVSSRPLAPTPTPTKRQRLGARLEDQQRGEGKKTTTDGDNPLAVGLVAVLTEALRLAGVGRDRFAEAEAAAADDDAGPRPRAGDVAAVARRIQNDFARAYFVVGRIDGGIYADDCRFADPTVAFRGVRLWRRNLALLTPFLIAPRIDLLPPAPEDAAAAAAVALAERGAGGGAGANALLAPLLRLIGGKGGSGRGSGSGSNKASTRVVCLGPVGPNGEQVLRARWDLETTLNLPWKPLISLRGSTDYTLCAEANCVVDHVESWEISGGQALMQLFRTGGVRREEE